MAAFLARHAATGGKLEDREALLLAWFVVAAGWALAAAQSHSTAAAVGVTPPGSATRRLRRSRRAIPAMFGANWRLARYLLPAAAAAALVAINYTIDWARLERVGNGGERRPVILLSAAVLLAAWASSPRTGVRGRRCSRPALVVGILADAPGGLRHRPERHRRAGAIPAVDRAGRQIRDIALETIAEQPAARFRFTRSSPRRSPGPSATVAPSRSHLAPSASATIVIWPAGIADAGRLCARWQGTWAFEESVTPPTGTPCAISAG